MAAFTLSPLWHSFTRHGSLHTAVSPYALSTMDAPRCEQKNSEHDLDEPDIRCPPATLSSSPPFQQRRRGSWPGDSQGRIIPDRRSTSSCGSCHRRLARLWRGVAPTFWLAFQIMPGTIQITPGIIRLRQGEEGFHREKRAYARCRSDPAVLAGSACVRAEYARRLANRSGLRDRSRAAGHADCRRAQDCGAAPACVQPS
jgi:hypothetical protein